MEESNVDLGINLKYLAKQKFDEFYERHTEMSFTEILYSILRNCKSRGKSQVSWIHKMDDNELYTAIDKTIKIEDE